MKNKIKILDNCKDEDALECFFKNINTWINSAVLISYPYDGFPENFKFVFKTGNEKLIIETCNELEPYATEITKYFIKFKTSETIVEYLGFTMLDSILETLKKVNLKYYNILKYSQSIPSKPSKLEIIENLFKEVNK